MQNEIVAHNDLKIRVQEGFFTPVESKKLLENFINCFFSNTSYWSVL